MYPDDVAVCPSHFKAPHASLRWHSTGILHLQLTSHISQLSRKLQGHPKQTAWATSRWTSLWTAPSAALRSVVVSSHTALLLQRASVQERQRLHS